ncbi:hypothetical protein DZF91_20910 [Actinomadura logoneensis]|uniref:Uncharacterized protein n=1 Tax=Actinomadura logoneensis TaxID=2293572 RepID=A0A372JI66_9ACTN|nr:hypothetical protein [Actinomadura logoneensis]RFU39722.1 hypothetical protein DZF91_20910 [Actinomadura logoneensis]
MRLTPLAWGTATVTALTLTAPATAHAAPAPTQTKITGLRVATDATRHLSLSGRLTTASGTSAGAGRQIIVETADAAHGHWFTYAKPLVTKADGTFKTDARHTSAHYLHGYFRVRFAGAPGLAATRSGDVRDRRIATRVTGWKVSTTHPRRGSTFTVRGYLQEKPGTTWKGLKGRRVSIEYCIKGGDCLNDLSLWHGLSNHKSDTKGYFSTRIRVAAKAKPIYLAYTFYGDSTHYVTWLVKPVLISPR